MRLAVILFGLLLMNGPALAQQDYAERVKNLVALSEILGEMHHIRRFCEPGRESDVWRNRMKKLVELEDPPATERDKMVRAFNTGYARAGSEYPVCSRKAEDYAAWRAEKADQLVRTLSASLYRQLSLNEALPRVWRGSETVQ